MQFLNLADNKNVDFGINQKLNLAFIVKTYLLRSYDERCQTEFFRLFVEEGIKDEGNCWRYLSFDLFKFVSPKKSWSVMAKLLGIRIK